MPHPKRLFIRATLTALFFMKAELAYCELPNSYIGPDQGGWLTPANWTANAIPDASFDAFLNFPSPLTVRLNDFTAVHNLTITPSQSLDIQPLGYMRVFGDALANDGTITLDGNPNTPQITFKSNATLSGAGTIQMLAPTSLLAADASVRLTTSNTITGQGTIGLGNSTFTNTGTIIASSGTLTIAPLDTPAAPIVDHFINTGTLRADGGRLVMNPSSYANVGGVIEAVNNATVDFLGRISGGIMRGLGGTISISNATARDVAFSGNIFANASTFYGTVSNAGTLTAGKVGIQSYANLVNTGTVSLNASWLSIYQNCQFTGGGTILMQNFTNFISSTNTVISNNNIVGQGTISEMRLTNTGSITASLGTLTLQPGVSHNSAFLRADGGILRVAGGPWDNASGTIEALHNSIVDLRAKVTGGTIRALSGTVTLASGVILENVALDGNIVAPSGTVTLNSGANAGTLALAPFVTTYLSGSISNTGTLILQQGTIVPLNTDLFLTGGGTVISNATDNFFYQFSNSRLTTDNVLSGRGNLGGGTLKFTNSGTITSNGGFLTLQPAQAPDALINTGLISATNGGSLLLSSAPCINTGGVIKSFPGTIVAVLSIVTGGSIVSDGTFSLNGFFPNPVDSISGIGAIRVNAATSNTVTVASLTVGQTLMIRPSGSGGGTSKINSLTLNSTTSSFIARFDIADNALIVQPPATSNRDAVISTLKSNVALGTTNTKGITSTTVAADPTHKTLAFADNAFLHLTTFGNLPVDDTALLFLSTWFGDSNLDRKIDVADLGTLATYYGQPVPNGILQGDFNQDGTVDVTDLGLLATNYGQGAAPGATFSLESDLPRTSTTSSPAPIPEPSTLAIIIPPFLLVRRARSRLNSRHFTNTPT